MATAFLSGNAVHPLSLKDVSDVTKAAPCKRGGLFVFWLIDKVFSPIARLRNLQWLGMAIILRRPRDRQKLGEEVMAMRRRLLDSRSHRDGWFNVKDDVGGLIDFEFIIQYLVLGNAHAAADGYSTHCGACSTGCA